MKILYVALKYDYGDPKRGYSFEHYNFYDSLVKMNGGEHSIIYFPFDEKLQELGRDGMNDALYELATRERPDLCFFFLYSDELKKEVVKKITESGIVTLNWFADDHYRYETFSREWAPCFTYITTTDSHAPAKYIQSGYKNVIKTQWGCNHFLYKPTGSLLKYDISFVGQPHSNRKQIIETLEKKGYSVACFGKGWDHGRISQEEMIAIFGQSKINLNLTNNLGGWTLKNLVKIFLKKSGKYIVLRTPSEIVRNMKYFFQVRREQIKGRNFEVPGCGGFLLTEDADNLKDYYILGEEIVVYRGIDDLVDKIEYYLSHEDKRSSIARRGYERTMAEHTYEKRFNDIFRQIFS